jgi:HSP20 family molecular chaperone IbpA
MKQWPFHFGNIPGDRPPENKVIPEERIAYGIDNGVPAANISEGPEEYVLTLDCPGYKREDFSVTIKNHDIHINAKKNSLIHDGIEAGVEPGLRKWMRSFLLPADACVFLTRANYLSGELIIHIPKGVDAHMSNLINVYVY